MIRAVLLDLDDTLTERRATVRAYTQHFLHDFGQQFRLADLPAVAAEIGRIDDHGYNRNRASDLAAHAAWISRPGADALAAHWDHHFAACTQARDGLSEVVAALTQSGFRLGVVTNGRTDRQRRKIQVLQLQDRLGTLLISEELGVAKPDPRIFRAAAKNLGVRPRECMFIGDNPEKDVCAASSVGMRAVWLRGALPWPRHLKPPHETIASLREVLELPGLHSY